MLLNQPHTTATGPKSSGINAHRLHAFDDLELSSPTVPWAHRLTGLLRRHPRTTVGSLTLAMTTFAVAAFGVAPVSPTLPPASRVVVDTLAPADVSAQQEALASHQTVWHHSAHNQTGDTVTSLLKRLNVHDPKALAFARGDVTLRKLVDGRQGRRVRATVDAQGRLLTLTAAMPASDSARASSHYLKLKINAIEGGFASLIDHVPLDRSVRIGSGTIRSSLFEATDAAQVPDAVAIQIAEIFSSDIDFHRELKRGDTFRVVYETLMADGEPVPWNEGSGRVLAVEFVNGKTKHEAIWYSSDPQGRGQYYDFAGNSRRKAFLASPLEFSRVSSGFAMRLHPTHKTWKQHLGVDYAAPTGTPVRVVGDGVVEIAGGQGGYGNVVIVKHSQQRQTVYAHLSRVDVRAGQTVQQGQHIGAVGSTGLSTGPHLHFEFRVAGTHQDPMVIARASETVPLPAHAKGQFEGLADVQRQRLNVALSLVEARGKSE